MRYLMITFLRQPGGQINEEVKAAKRVRNSDSASCNIIVDYGTKQIVKCVVEGKVHDTDFDKMNQYYKKIYPKLIEQLEKEGPIQAKAKETK